MTDKLKKIKDQKWFYEFDLPDGSKTESYLPEIARKIHVTRENALRKHLNTLGNTQLTAMDISCHEGFFSNILSEYFKTVIGLDKNIESLDKARLISDVLGKGTIDYQHSSVEQWDSKNKVDFVLCFGLLYHIENPVEVLRKLAILTEKTICIETQILPNSLEGSIEDGSYMWQRDLQGMFGLCIDYSKRPEGGMTDLALVPSRNALEFLLKQFGFKTVNFYKPVADDYEQFTRNHRVILFADK